MTNFGASLKKARESQGISLDQISKETRISMRFLAAIENEEFHLLPGGVFNRGFVRTFAERVGLDPDQMVADYVRLVSPPEPVAIAPASVNAPPSKSERRLYPVAIGILALALAIFYLVTRESGRSAETANLPTAVSTPAPAVQSPPTTSTSTPSAPEPAPAPETTPAAPSPPPAAVSTPEPARPVVTKPQAMTLDIEAHETTWIKVTSDGNSVNAGEVLEPGMTRKFTAQNSIYISVGNAAGLTLKINDKPLKPLGKTGQVRSVTITPATLKDFIG